MSQSNTYILCVLFSTQLLAPGQRSRHATSSHAWPHIHRIFAGTAEATCGSGDGAAAGLSTMMDVSYLNWYVKTNML